MISGDVTTLLAIVLGTFVSEDLAGIAAGLLVADSTLAPLPAVAAAWLGIWLGDLALWAAGRVIRRAPESDLVTRRPAVAIVTSRFLPGTRLAVYVAAGAGRVPLSTFAFWSALATAIWTPLLVGSAAVFGRAVEAVVHAYVSLGWLLLPAALWWLWRRRPAGASLQVALGWLRRWEFWPAWLFYAPVIPWVAYLLITRGPRALFAANPGLEDAGFAGESKSRILASLPAPWVLPHVLVAPGPAEARLRALDQHMAAQGWSFPVVLKPDVGQRGDGVRVVEHGQGALDYLRETPGAVVAQVYHPGPYEAGVFYYRRPGEAQGTIFSLTDKHFPHVVGDGRSTLEQLIRSHRRYRLQASLFLSQRADLRRVPRAGERVLLGATGNHAKGAIFLDGADLVTDRLTARIDEIARQVDGFFIGRFDVRYRDPRAFMAGEDLAIVELNGVTSEATHIYDPASNLFRAYRTLFAQWRLVFDIGAANRAAVPTSPGLGRLMRLSVEHVLR